MMDDMAIDRSNEHRTNRPTYWFIHRTAWYLNSLWW